MEAMAVGRCVVTCAVEPVTELVVDGVSGLVVPEEDASALAAAIRRIATDRELRETVRRGAHRRVADEFDRGANVRALIDCWRLAMAGPMDSAGAQRQGVAVPADAGGAV
jgi:glycosyltransferase involved in cell wall biosynthesis